MSKKFVVLVVVVVLLLAAVGSAAAITNGQPDGDGHPYVGVVSDFNSFCSGVAISPSVLVTAAHCFENGAVVLVNFEASPGGFEYEDLYIGVFYQHPGYCADCGPGLPGAYVNDLAVITPLVNYVTGEPPDLARYGALPAPGLIETLANKTDATVVGYGVQGFIPGGGPPMAWSDQTRHMAGAEVITSSQANSYGFVKLAARQGNGNGGICLGDSGGPVLLGDSDTVLSLSTYMTNGNCAGVTYSTRMDTESALGFVGLFGSW